MGSTSCHTDGACDNVAIGRNAGVNITCGDDNVLIGKCAGDGITCGINNIAIGSEPGHRITSAASNITIGRIAGSFITTGENNVIMGQEAGGGLNAGTNNTMIGQNAGSNPEISGNRADTVTFGNHQITGFNVSASLGNPSDCRDKTDVEDLDLGLGYIKALRPVYYKWDKRGDYEPFFTKVPKTDAEITAYKNFEPDGTKKKPRWEIGLLAQEALTAEQAHTSKTGTGDDEGVIVQGSENRTYNMSYQKIIMPLIKSVKELDAQLAALTTRVAALE